MVCLGWWFLCVGAQTDPVVWLGHQLHEVEASTNMCRPQALPIRVGLTGGVGSGHVRPSVAEFIGKTDVQEY